MDIFIYSLQDTFILASWILKPWPRSSQQTCDHLHLAGFFLIIFSALLDLILWILVQFVKLKH